MKLKPGVRVRGLRPEIAIAMLVVEGICRDLAVEFIVTSGSDGRHSLTSLHYAGAAFDMRSRNMDIRTKHVFLDAARKALGDDFDVLDETDHFHIEYQPQGES